MRFLKTLLLGIAMLMASTSAPAQRLSQVDLEDINGTIVKLPSLKDGERPMLLVFWAFCRPDMRLFDAIERNMDEWSREVKFHVVTIAIGDNVPKIQSYIRGSNSWSGFTHLFDRSGEASEAARGDGVIDYHVPAVVIYDKNGKLVHHDTGYEEGKELKYFEILKGLQ